MPTTRLVLFDIDGTLLSTDGAARRAFRAALLELFGVAGPIDRHSFCGKTDPQIVGELLTAAGLPAKTIAAGLPALWQNYLERLRKELRHSTPRVYAGVHAILERIDSDKGQLVPGLLTGNIEEGARAKVDAAGLDFGRFPVGAFGSDHADRHQLPAVAVERAAQLLGYRFEGKAVIIVGDTPADISCGRKLGVRTVAVATGTFSKRQLAICRPDYLFASLEDLEAVWQALTTEMVTA
ncbi:MAG: HAD family hydrolase [Acidobacteriota bacterium]